MFSQNTPSDITEYRQNLADNRSGFSRGEFSGAFSTPLEFLTPEAQNSSVK